MFRFEAVDQTWDQIKRASFDVGVWALGYESRSKWLVSSGYAPKSVRTWYRIEYEVGSGPLSAINSNDAPTSELFGGRAIAVGHDGEWLECWRHLLSSERRRLGRPLKVFIDYSSMPRTVYGTLLFLMRSEPQLVSRVVGCYVPGRHAASRDGSTLLIGLRALIGTEGMRATSEHGVAFVLGLGFDGYLAESLVELYQIDHYGCVYADPGVHPDSAERTRGANRTVLSKSEWVARVAAHSVSDAKLAFADIAARYAHNREVVLVPFGPKPHVLGAVILAYEDPEVALRWALPAGETAVPVDVDPGTVPKFVSITPFA